MTLTDLEIKVMQPQQIGRYEQLALSSLSAGAEGRAYFLEHCCSTMDIARALIDQKQQLPVSAITFRWGLTNPLSDMFLVLSHAQSRGRGRSNRPWVSPAGSGLYLTLVTALPGSELKLEGLSLVIGLAVWDAVLKFGVKCALKWPNDVLIQVEERRYKKLAGILIETITSGDTLYVCSGIGVNLRHGAYPSEVPAVSLSEAAGRVIDPELFLRELLQSLAKYMGMFFKSGFVSLRNEWLEASMVVGRQVEFQLDNTLCSGTVIGVDERGALTVEVSGDLKSVFSGEVRFIDATCN